MSDMVRALQVHCEGPVQAEPTVVNGTALDRGATHLWFTALAPMRLRLEEHAHLLDAEERQRADRFRFDVDRERFISAHGLLRTLLGRYTGQAPEAIQFARGPYGKPYLKDSDLHFNLSDTKDAVLIALSHGQEIGVDLETMTRSVDHHAVSEHYFTNEEIADIRSAPDDKRRFLELWTRKEAVLKASGVGIMDDLRVLRVDGRVNTMTIGHAAFVAHAADAYHVRSWHLGRHHIMSLASSSPLGPVLVALAQ